MLQRFGVLLLVVAGLAALPLWGQQPCPGAVVAVGTPEDTLMLAYNGADNPTGQLDALQKFEQAHADSKFIPCANEYIAAVDLKLKNYDQSIEYAEKDLAANYQDLYLDLNLLRAYAASGKVSDNAFAVIDKIPEQVKTELGNVPRPAKATDAEWKQIQDDNADAAKNSHDLAVWAFFQLLPRVPDPAKRIQVLDNFLKTYPEAEKDEAAQVNLFYFQAYQASGNVAKTLEYGDKVIAVTPDNVEVLNAMGLINAFALPHPEIDKAAEYAQKALTAANGAKKPEGMDDAAFKKTMDTQMGIAHLTLGFAALEKLKLGPSFTELKAAVPLLEGNPALQGQALYYLAFAYERGTPANHRAAMEALNKAVTLPGPFQGQSQALLAKVKAAR